MDETRIDEAGLFNEARQIKDPAERDEFVTRSCGSNSGLRERILRLLAEYSADPAYLSGDQSLGFVTPGQQLALAMIGTRIGPYELTSVLGEGGMGVVFLAEQREPIRRKVALKLIKPGMDSQDILNRFSAERQALALMDHPYIARALDAGTSPDGHPYFVMEYVDGVPITQYCTDERLPTDDRLKLFRMACEAVMHAHQKGVIHRDLKPTNILVTEQDGHPVPKVIDFGVAKAMSQSLTDKSLFTTAGQLLGTLEYMSPERVRLDHRDVDTRADIYAMGVVLYELMTDLMPFDHDQLRTATFDEMLRIIREVDPPRPSLRLAGSQSLDSTAESQHSTPSKLRQRLSTEVDWVVMKAIEKDRSRRYESMDAFAADIGRILDNEPVAASPPSWSYQLKKLYQRRRSVVISGSLLLACIVTVAVLSARLAYVERQAREKAQELLVRAEAGERLAIERLEMADKERESAERISMFFRKLLVQSNLYEWSSWSSDAAGGPVSVLPDPKVSQVLQTAREFLRPERIEQSLGGLPRVQVQVLDAIGMTLTHIGHRAEAVDCLQQAAAIAESLEADDPLIQGTKISLAEALQETSRTTDAERLASEIYEAVGKDVSQEGMRAARLLSEIYRKAGKYEDALALAERAREVAVVVHGDRSPAVLQLDCTIGLLHGTLGDHERAVRHLKETSQTAQAVLGASHPVSLESRMALACELSETHRTDEAIVLVEPQWAEATTSLDVTQVYHKVRIGFTLGKVLRGAERNADARRVLNEVLAECRRHLAQSYQEAAAVVALADLYHHEHNDRAAIELLKPLLEGDRQASSTDLWLRAWVQFLMAECLFDSDQPDDAGPLLESARETFSRMRSPDCREALQAEHLMAGVLNKQKSYEQAELRARSVFERVHQRFPKDHLLALASSLTLCEILIDRRKEAEAQPLLALRCGEPRCDDPGRRRLQLRLRVTLGKLHKQQKRVSEAADVLTSSLSESEELFGVTDGLALQTRLELGCLRAEQGQYTEAVAVLKPQLEASISTFGPAHSKTAHWFKDLSGSLAYLGRFTEAAQLAERHLSHLEDAHGRADPRTVVQIDRLASFVRGSGHRERAISLRKEAYDLSRTALRPEDPALTGRCASLWRAYTENRQYSDACRLMETHLEGVEAETRPPTDNDVGFARGLMEVYFLLGKRDEGIQQAKMCQRWSEKVHGADTAKHAEVLNRLGDRCNHHREFELALDCAKRAIEIWEKVEPNGWRRGHADLVFGTAYNGQGNPEEAIPLLETGVTRMAAHPERLPSSARGPLVQALGQLIDCYKALDKDEMAAASSAERQRIILALRDLESKQRAGSQTQSVGNTLSEVEPSSQQTP